MSGQHEVAGAGSYTWPERTLPDGNYQLFWGCTAPDSTSGRSTWGTAPFLPTDEFPNEAPTATPATVGAGPSAPECTGSLCLPGIID
ncbi:hypothetical protein [Gordonia namibiensis]|uniref:hypothetical protein n=1 Tax=Gordonia namibiensis TaxID=168480 RepID=UPI0012F66281|nr:hypothetical protein [Gordonia namibiensis]